MTRKPDDLDRYGALLERLFSGLHENVPAGWVRPDEDIINAYICKRATAAQKRAIRESMHVNVEFQAEISARCQAYDEIDDLDLARDMCDVDVPLQELVRLARHSQIPPRKRGSVFLFPFNSRDLFRRPMIAVSIAAAAVFCMIMIWALGDRGQPEMPERGQAPLIQLDIHRVLRSHEIIPSNLAIPPGVSEFRLAPPVPEGLDADRPVLVEIWEERRSGDVRLVQQTTESDLIFNKVTTGMPVVPVRLFRAGKQYRIEFVPLGEGGDPNRDRGIVVHFRVLAE